MKDLRKVASAPQATAIESVITHRLGIQQECHLNFTKAGRKVDKNFKSIRIPGDNTLGMIC